MIYRFKICQKYTTGRRHVSREKLKTVSSAILLHFISLECLTQVCFCDNKPREGSRGFVDYVLSNSLDASLFRARSINKINNQSKSRKSLSCDNSRDLYIRQLKLQFKDHGERTLVYFKGLKRHLIRGSII